MGTSWQAGTDTTGLNLCLPIDRHEVGDQSGLASVDENLPPSGELGRLRSVAAALPEPVVLETDRPDLFRAQLRMSVLGALTVGEIGNRGDASLDAYRTPRL